MIPQTRINSFLSSNLFRILIATFFFGQLAASAQTMFVSSTEELGLVNLDDGSYTPLTASPIRAESLAYDSSRDEILALESDDRTITRYDVNGGFVGRVVTASPIADVTVTSSGDYYASVNNRIFRLNRITGELLPFVTLQSTTSINSIIASNNELLVTNATGEFVRISVQDQLVIETKPGDYQTVGYGPDQNVVYAVEEVSSNPDSGAVYRVDISAIPAEFELIGTFEDVYAAAASGDSDIVYLAKGTVRGSADELMAFTQSTATLDLLPIDTRFQYGIFAYGSTPNKGILTMVYEQNAEQWFGLRFYSAPNNTLTPLRADSKSYTAARKLLRLEGNDLLAYQPDVGSTNPGSSRLYDARNFSPEFSQERARTFQSVFEDRTRDQLMVVDGRDIISLEYELRRTSTLGTLTEFPGDAIWAEQAGVVLASQVSGQTVTIAQPDGAVVSTFRLDFAPFGYNFYEVSDNSVLYFSGAERNVGEDLYSKSFRDLQAPQELVFEVGEDDVIVDVEMGQDSTEVFLVLKTDSGTPIIRITKDFSTGTYRSATVTTLPSKLNVTDSRFFGDLFVSGAKESNSSTTSSFEAWWDGAELQVRKADTQPANIQVHDLSGRLLTRRRIGSLHTSMPLPASSSYGVVVVSVEVDGEVGTKVVTVSN